MKTLYVVTLVVVLVNVLSWVVCGLVNKFNPYVGEEIYIVPTLVTCVSIVLIVLSVLELLGVTGSESDVTENVVLSSVINTSNNIRNILN